MSMTTNGYYSLDVAHYVSEHIDNVLLSFDGPEDIQNIHRPPCYGEESHSLVFQTAQYLSSHARSFSIRPTVSSYSVNRMPEIVAYFHNALGSKYHLVFEPLVPLGRAVINQKIVKEPSKKGFVRYYIKAKEEGLQRGIEIRTSAANHKRLVTSFCGAMSIPSFTVTTKGLVTTCERDSDGKFYSYGRYVQESRSFEFDQDRIDKNNQLLSIPSKCQSCFCKWHCAGDCPDVRSINYERCYVNRELIRHELEIALEPQKSKHMEGGEFHD